MARPRKKYSFRQSRQPPMFVGLFHDYGHPSKGNPIRRDLCSEEEAKWKQGKNGRKKLRTEQELVNFLDRKWQEVKTRLENHQNLELSETDPSPALKTLITKYLDEHPMSDEWQRHVKRYLQEIWLRHLGSISIKSITPAMVVDVRDQLAKSSGKTSANRAVSALSGLLTACVKDWYYLDVNPCHRIRRLKESKGRERFLNDDERKRLIQNTKSNQNLHLALILSLATGGRKSEILNLRWGDLDLSQQKSVIFRNTKNHETRSVPLVDNHALTLLRNHVKYPGTDLVFPSRYNKRRPYSPRKPFEQALKASGIEDFTWHDLRHSCASYLVMNGVPLRTVAEILGHKTLSMVQRYSHLAPDHLRESVGKLPKLG